MKNRNRQRWLRRLALGLALATAAFAGPAQATHDVDGAQGSSHPGSRFVTAGGWSGYVDQETGIPTSAGLAGIQAPEQQVPAVADSPQEYAGISVATRPDDRADRFAHTDDVVAGSAADSGRTIEWEEGLGLGIAALVLALGIALGIGYLRRPRLAL